MVWVCWLGPAVKAGVHVNQGLCPRSKTTPEVKRPQGAGVVRQLACEKILTSAFHGTILRALSHCPRLLLTVTGKYEHSRLDYMGAGLLPTSRSTRTRRSEQRRRDTTSRREIRFSDCDRPCSYRFDRRVEVPFALVGAVVICAEPRFISVGREEGNGIHDGVIAGFPNAATRRYAGDRAQRRMDRQRPPSLPRPGI
jgi:hypothetical protein